MLKRTCLLFFILVSQLPMYASSIAGLTPPYLLSGQKYIDEPKYIDGATKIIELILETVGLRASFEVKRANVPNAAAVVYQGKRYVLYNPSFIAAMDKAAGTPWASVAVLAHEIGHHLSGHTLDGNGSLPEIELEADEFSGFALRKMGASLAEAQVAMRIVASAKATRTHPGRGDRLMAIATGWNRADEQSGEQHTATRNLQRNGSNSILQSKDIAFDVHFGFDRDAKYHVTRRNELVKLSDNQLQLLGKLVTTGKRNHPLAFHINSNVFLFINREGKIVNSYGEAVGSITPHQ